jgi:hypothetical protein
MFKGAHELNAGDFTHRTTFTYSHGAHASAPDNSCVYTLPTSAANSSNVIFGHVFPLEGALKLLLRQNLSSSAHSLQKYSYALRMRLTGCRSNA